MPGRVTRDAAVSEIVQSLRRIFKVIQDYSQQVLDKFGVSGPQLWTLKTISQYRNLSLGDLSKKMYLDPSTITGLVDRLEKKGYAVRDRGQRDRRVIKVQLTPKGKRLARKTPNPAQGKMIYGLRRLPKEKLYLMYSCLQKLVEIMEAENVKATFFFSRE